MPDSIYALILAGGSGERFAVQPEGPTQTTSAPRFGKKLCSKRRLARLEGLVPSERILILTNTDQESGVRSRSGVCRRKIFSPSRRNATPPRQSRSGPAGSRARARRHNGRPSCGSRHPTAPAFQRTLLVAAAAAEETSELVTMVSNRHGRVPASVTSSTASLAGGVSAPQRSDL